MEDDAAVDLGVKEVQEDQKTVWRKGNPRSIEEASSCQFLAVGSPFQTTRLLIPKKGVVMAHETGVEEAQLIMPIQPFSLLCNNPLIIQFSQMAAEQMIQGVVGKVQAMSLNGLDLCRMCPYHKGPQLQ